MRHVNWINRFEYPFRSRYFDLEAGWMHYVDEGEGGPVVMLHGNPAWSFAYRRLIKALRGDYRCIAPDMIGFGLSDKPSDWSYLPEDHAENFGRFVEGLGLRDITLVVQDWGGPVGMSYAVKNPENVSRIVVLNSFAWPVNDDLHFRLFSSIAGGAAGRFAVERFNFFARFMMKSMFRTSLVPGIHRHYLVPLGKPEERKGSSALPGHVTASGDWLAGIYASMDNLRDKPALIAWGMKDIAFREKEMRRWLGIFSSPELVKFKGAGHFVQEDAGFDLNDAVWRFLARHRIARHETQELARAS